MSQFKLIVFDLDDTLIPSTRIYSEVEAEVFAEFHDFFLKSRLAVKQRLPTMHVAARNRLLYIKTMLDLFPVTRKKSVMRWMEEYEQGLNRKIVDFSKTSQLEFIFSEVSKFADIVILTNENLRTQLVKLDSLGLGVHQYVSKMITSEEVGFEKPSEFMFKEVELSFADVKPEQICMVGDSVKSDVAPALLRSWRAIQTKEFVQDLEIHGGHTVSALSEILKIVGRP